MAHRDGETLLPFDPADRIDAGLSFIGHIRSDWGPGTAPKNVRQARESGSAARIELLDGYAEALTGLEVGQPIQLLYWVDRGERNLATQSPKHADAPRGTFSLRSPVRPNPIALATVFLTSIDGHTLGIDAIDAWDGTPVLDIKPWIATVDVPPGWQP
ncbi:tRNA (N6-threonylcarbamoyladenosine(37)-N6)-methyltransferase TrmO [Rhodobacterales bacterium HKCCE4037]|nr:tRNA (N6-threonylcarbamoyladenosine(37)-N6)-methyltransferase TrmO [Rhodobacterales bacterium HKCCE4037]